MMRSYPHMCRDGHAEIGFAGHSGDCPMCERIAAVEAALRAIFAAADGATSEQDWAERVSAAMTDERRALVQQ